jgi:hypothetical protein
MFLTEKKIVDVELNKLLEVSSFIGSFEISMDKDA